MVRVISDGPTKTKRVICPNCAYELEYTGEDVYSFTDSDGDRFQHIFCPRAECASSNGRISKVQISVKWP